MGMPFKRGNAEEWTLERIASLSIQDIKQLRDNAERLNEPEVAELCKQALKEERSSAGRARRRSPVTKARRLIARGNAFEARGVFLEDARLSWGGVRKSDGGVVMALWAEAIEAKGGGCRYLLWAPNADGTRPWSDKPAGKERLAHCKLAIERGGAEGLLVYGQRLTTHQPEDKAYAIHGVDAETVVRFQVEESDGAFWARWGKKTASTI